MDLSNAAVKKQLDVPPAALDKVADDPAVLEEISRVQALALQHHMFTLAMRSENLPQIATAHERISKNANLAPKEGATTGAGFSININIPAVGGQPATVIEAKANPIDVEAIQLPG